MDANVVFQVTALHRPVGAMGTGEWLFTSVYSIMTLKVLVGGCRVWTEGAAVRLFPRVSPQVYVKVVAAERRIVADGAREGLLHVKVLQGDAYN